MNPTDPNDPQGTDPLKSAPGTNPTWNQPSQKPETRPAGQADGADEDEDMDDVEGSTRQAGAMNPGRSGETPDDAMRRDRGQQGSEQGGRQHTQPDRKSDDQTGQ